MRKAFVGIGAALALATQPVAAQEDTASPGEPSAEQMEQIMGMFGSMFQADPLTPEQEARLPASQALVQKIMPDGFYGEIMAKTMDGVLEPIMGMFSGPTGADLVLSTRLAIDPENLADLDGDAKMEIVRMLDPAYDQRGEVMRSAFAGMMTGMFDQLEPPMREGLSRAYAVRFSEEQLADIAAFFETPTGGLYARESMALFTDPQVMSATMQAMPAMMSGFSDFETIIKTAMEELPAERAFTDLSVEERQRLGELLGLPDEELSDAVVAPKDMSESED